MRTSRYLRLRGFKQNRVRPRRSTRLSLETLEDRVMLACPCTIWPSTATPQRIEETDTAAIEVGVKFRSDLDGSITGIRFYKGSTNTGTHVGNLWTRTGGLLASVTFTNETASGWQQASLASPVAITANTTYVSSYHTSVGRYAVSDSYFTTGVDNPPLHALANGVDGGNGVFKYGASGFPTESFNASNYWVDLVFADTAPPTVTAVSPANAASNVSTGTNVTVTFSEPMDPTSVNTNTFELRDAANSLIAASVTYEATTQTATLDPSALLVNSTTYTAIVKGGTTDPRVKDAASNALAANHTWSFTTTTGSCPCTIWSQSATPERIEESDTNAIEVGVKFRSDLDGFITAIRFYKGANNVGRHVGNLWTSAGTLLASIAVGNETASGWQQASFGSPVPIAANTTYVASYHSEFGRYAVSDPYFTTTVVNPPLRALADGADGGNGVHKLGESGFPTTAFNASNYWIDVVFHTDGTDRTPPTVLSVVPANGALGVSAATNVTVKFSEAMDAPTINTNTFELRDPSGALVSGTVSYDPATTTATFDPSGLLATTTTYTVIGKGGTADPRVKDTGGNALAANHSLSFTTVDTGPGGPILIAATASDPFSRYYSEILRAEGLDEFLIVDVSEVSSTTLSAHDVVILGAMPLTAAQVSMFSDWVQAGGNLVAMRPDKQLAGLLGLSDAATTLSNAYLLVNTTSSPGIGITDQTIQFHGTADAYTPNGATSVATLYATAATPTLHPAVTLRSVGTSGGQVAAFTYDLARSVVYTRQGNPAWASQDRDGKAPIRTNDLFFGAATSDPQPDWIDLNKAAIPQADEQQRLLANLIYHMNLDKKPLPRFWYFPHGKKAVVVMTGDDHANGGTAGRFDQYKSLSPSACSVNDLQCIRSTSYIYAAHPMTNTQAAGYTADGFEIALHVDVGCRNYTPDSLEFFYIDQLHQLQTAYPSLPAPATVRTHCAVWSDYDTQPQVERKHGIRLDTNYYYWPADWILNRPGMFTGSGMLMRFAKLDGSIINVYQAATQMTDESGQSYPFTSDTLLDRALGPLGYYGAFVVNAHTDAAKSAVSDAVVNSARTRNVPIVSARQMLNFLDGRNSSSFGSLAWDATKLTLSFTMTVGAGATGLRAMVPTRSLSNALVSITRDGTPIGYTRETIKGVDYALVPAIAGSYVTHYDTTPPTVSITDPVGGAAVAGTVTLSANASDNVELVGVQFLLDGSNLGAEDTVAPYSISWDSTKASNGSHNLTARARDAAGNTATSGIVTVTVDNATPVITLTSPADGAIVAGTITVSANASDNVSVVGVQFLLDGSNLGAEDTVAPYSISWNTTTASNGSHKLTARARDAAGNTTTSSVTTVTVDNSAPAVSITTPSHGGSVSGTVAVSADASDNVGVAGVQFFLDGDKLGGEDTVAPYAVAWDTTTATNGSHMLTARARDAAGNFTTSNAVAVTVDNIAPTVVVTSPSNGAVVSGTITVSADASDNVGVAGVQFLLDGANLGPEDTVAPYAVLWNTTTTTNGLHTLTARARDAAGNQTTSSEVSVTVLNALLSVEERPVAPNIDAAFHPVATGGAMPMLTSTEMEPLVAEAIAQWAVVGVDTAQLGRLRDVEVQIVDLAGPHLGLATATGIWIDRDAAGYGWFVDASPSRHEEFRQGGRAGELRAVRHSPALGRVDLLSVLAHELGHVLGLEHSPGAAHDVMAGGLPPGVRRLPVAQPPVTHADVELAGLLDDLVLAGRLAVSASGSFVAAGAPPEPAPRRVSSASDPEPELLEEARERPALASRGSVRTLERVERLSNKSLAIGAARFLPLADSTVLDAALADLLDEGFWSLSHIDEDEVE